MCLALTASAGTESRKDGLKSNGVLNIKDNTRQISLDSSDLAYLADQIDVLESSYKSTATQSLSSVGQTVNGNDWGSICFAIEHSQDVGVAAIQDNLSAGKQAWVQGTLITGNGADVDAAYRKGATDGFNRSMAGARVSYVYHQHTSACWQGCHVHTDDCSREEPCPGWANAIGSRNIFLGCCHAEILTWKCDYCGAQFERTRHTGSDRCSNQPSDNSHTRTIPCCTGAINSTYLACGKTTLTIESATVTFN